MQPTHRDYHHSRTQSLKNQLPSKPESPGFVLGNISFNGRDNKEALDSRAKEPSFGSKDTPEKLQGKGFYNKVPRRSKRAPIRASLDRFTPKTFTSNHSAEHSAMRDSSRFSRENLRMLLRRVDQSLLEYKADLKTLRKAKSNIRKLKELILGFSYLF